MPPFEFPSDFVIPPIPSTRASSGVKFPPSTDAIRLAQDLTKFHPPTVMMLVEHPDPRVPLALAENSFLPWYTQEGGLSRGGGPTALALLNRAATDATAQDYLWTPLMDAMAARLYERPSEYVFRRISQYGFSHAHTNPTRRRPTPSEQMRWLQKWDEKKAKDYFFKSPYGTEIHALWRVDGHQNQRLEYKLRAATEALAPNRTELLRAFREYHAPMILSLISGNLTPNIGAYKLMPRTPRNLIFTSQEILATEPAKTIHLVDQPALTPQGATDIVRRSLYASRHKRDEAFDRFFARTEDLKEHLENLVEHCAHYQFTDHLSDIIRTTIRHDKMTPALLDVIMKHLVTLPPGVHQNRIVGVLDETPLLTPEHIHTLLDCAEPYHRSDLAKHPTSLSDTSLARRFVNFKDASLTDIIMRGATPDVYAAIFDRAAQKRPDAATRSLIDRLDDVAPTLERRAIVPLLAKADQEARSKLIGALPKLAPSTQKPRKPGRG